MKNAMHRTARSTGQSVYEVMLILACAAMALAVFFTAYEYVSYYHGEAQTVPPLGSATAPRPAPRTAAPPVTPAPATTAAPAAAPVPTTTAAPGTTSAPATTP